MKSPTKRYNSCITIHDLAIFDYFSRHRFAMRARNIKNDPKVNDDPGDGVVKQYKEQAEKLHQEYKEKIAKMEEAHEEEVLQLKEELKKMQVRRLMVVEISRCIAMIMAITLKVNWEV